MSTYDVNQYHTAHGEISVRFGAGEANQLLLALERLDQEAGGLDPSLATLREALKAAIVAKSSGDTDSAPSTE